MQRDARDRGDRFSIMDPLDPFNDVSRCAPRPRLRRRCLAIQRVCQAPTAGRALHRRETGFPNVLGCAIAGRTARVRACLRAAGALSTRSRSARPLTTRTACWQRRGQTAESLSWPPFCASTRSLPSARRRSVRRAGPRHGLVRPPRRSPGLASRLAQPPSAARRSHRAAGTACSAQPAGAQARRQQRSAVGTMQLRLAGARAERNRRAEQSWNGRVVVAGIPRRRTALGQWQTCLRQSMKVTREYSRVHARG